MAIKGKDRIGLTFDEVNFELVHPLHTFFELVLGRRSHGVDIFVLAVVILHCVSDAHLDGTGAEADS